MPSGKEGRGGANRLWGAKSQPVSEILQTTQLDTDHALFDKDTILADILAHSNLRQLRGIAESLNEEMGRLQTMKKTLMSENYSKFILVDEQLKRLLENMRAAVAGMGRFQEELDNELRTLPSDRPIP